MGDLVLLKKSYVRVLSIPHGKKKDAHGRELGDDWCLAIMGEDHDNTKHYLTTDRIHASEIGLIELLEPEALAYFCAEKINKKLRKKHGKY